MFNRKSPFFHLIISTLTAITVIIAQPLVSQAFPWQEILIRGLQVIQVTTLSHRQEVELGKQMRQPD